MRMRFPFAVIAGLAITGICAAQSRAPRLVAKVEPDCTSEAREARAQGTVVLTATIDDEGVATNIRIVRGLDYGLNEKAAAAVEKWRFEPGIKNGQPAPVDATIEVNFRCE